eukprot:TRINITY_DN17332_c0_g2_i1.p1 TRINITY_DN17332_c0_g2~~TRINITY_DN17332_c0_g2_i1.p1  ORF type:complete len:269 (-),score=49.94 TRINITY_DN17332_c0_g2_i1:224-1030(-)
MYKGMLKKIKEVLIKTSEKENDLARKGEEIKEDLRNLLKEIEMITGIPKSMVISREAGKLVLKSSQIFAKTHDEFNESFKMSVALEELFQNIKVQDTTYIVESLDKWHSVIVESIPGEWVINSANSLQLSTAHPINRTRFRSNSVLPLNPNLVHIAAATTLTSGVHRVVYRVAKEVLGKLKRLRFKFKANRIKSLVPVKRGHGRQKSISFATAGMETVKPFSVYSAKKDDLRESSWSQRSYLAAKRAQTEGGISEHVLVLVMVESATS